MKPLFIPLKTEFYEAFKAGSKTTEYRLHGPRWNKRTCVVGRPVILAKGYGKANRLHGKICKVEVSAEPTQTEAWCKCYGSKTGLAVCISIELC